MQMFLEEVGFDVCPELIEAAMNEIDCGGLALSAAHLDQLLSPLRAVNGIIDEVTWLFDYLEDRKAEEEGDLMLVAA